MSYIQEVISGQSGFGPKPTKAMNYINERLPKELVNKYIDKSYYKHICGIINSMESTGTLYRSSGHCIGTSDLVLKLFSEIGIKCKLVECNLSIINRSDIGIKDIHLIGHQLGHNVNPIYEAPTHVVCVTETEVPFLIDLSVYGRSNINYMCIPLVAELIQHDKNIVTVELDDTVWIYNERKLSSLVDLHEKNIIDRINTDIKVDAQIKNLYKLLIAVSMISCLNFVRGTFDFYQKYLNRSNGFGPHQHKAK